MLKRGEIAPDFKIGDTSLYELLDERAAVVFFFPKAFTPGCTREASEFRRQFENLRRSGCDVVGVSRDPQDTSDRFRKSLDLPYALVGDAEGAVLNAFKVRWPVIGWAQRVTYLVGKDRKVRFAVHSEFNIPAHVSRACAAVAGPEE
jgi:thioredoxin-dependent peroxiredoxin